MSDVFREIFFIFYFNDYSIFFNCFLIFLFKEQTMNNKRKKIKEDNYNKQTQFVFKV
jgi:hypothetical protein